MATQQELNELVSAIRKQITEIMNVGGISPTARVEWNGESIPNLSQRAEFQRSASRGSYLNQCASYSTGRAAAPAIELQQQMERNHS